MASSPYDERTRQAASRDHADWSSGGGLTAPMPPSTPSTSLTTRVVLWVALAIAGAIFVMSAFSTTEQAPPHALVILDAKARVYTTPACAFSSRPTAPTVATRAEAEQRGYSPEPDCLRAGGFLGAGDSQWNRFLKRVFRTPAGKSRWRVDGTWRW